MLNGVSGFILLSLSICLEVSANKIISKYGSNVFTFLQNGSANNTQKNVAKSNISTTDHTL
jgi:hypothetical protein